MSKTKHIHTLIFILLLAFAVFLALNGNMMILELIIFVSIIALIIITYAISYIKLKKSSIKCDEKYKAALNLNEVIFKLSEEMTLTDDRNELYTLILKSAIDAIPGGKKGTIVDFTSNQYVNYLAYIGYDINALIELNLKTKNTYLYRETEGKMDRTIIIHDTLAYNKKSFPKDEFEKLIDLGILTSESTISTPIFINDLIIGIINIDSNEGNAFSLDDKRTIKYFANIASRIIRYDENFDIKKIKKPSI